ncbi:MAG: Transcriptional regulator, LuxR family [Mucilaginibacter sp.]|nr:Transcriptional regulator, LuxR family [Mucilaginibacter sp.]
MLVFGSQLHIVTFIFIILEVLMFSWQLARYFYRLKDRHRGWYCLLLLLLFLYNITNGLFPDPEIGWSVTIQNILANGTAFLMASYFPFYFYKEFELKELRRHVMFGVPLFFLLPYFVFFVLIYTINGHLQTDIRYGVIVPFIYSLFLLWEILCAIRKHYIQKGDHHFYIEELALYCAVLPWAAMSFFAWFEVGQLIEAICANIGFLVITVMFFVKSARRARQEYILLNHTNIDGIGPERFQANCLHYGLTKNEILIVQKIYKGMSTMEIAESMFIAGDTVKKHIQHIFRKTSVKNRQALIHKLQNHNQ